MEAASGGVRTDRSSISSFPMRGPREWGPGVEHLDEKECWRYLRSARIGRLAVVDEDGAVDIFPTNHTADQESLILRSGDGAKVQALTSGRGIAYEIDGSDDVDDQASAPRMAWSVVLRGHAAVVAGLDETLRLQSFAIAPWQGGTKERFVRLRGAVTGRRFVVTGSGWWSD